MSGIGVIFHRDGRLAKRDEIEKMARALRMYGPERLVFRLVGPVAFAYAHMSNTPESIYDDQPLRSRDGNLVMVFDGRLDNREDVQRELNISSSEAALMSDGRLALHSFEKHRLEAPARWVGDFAFIIWDNRQSILYAARDILGRRVLNCHETSDRVVIASAAKGIFALGDVAKEIDERKVADALGQLYYDQTRSYYKDIKRLPHGKIVIVDQSKVRFDTYWDVDDIPSIRFKSDDEYVDAAREQFETAVKAHMRSRGPIGAFMSGGWDSSTVAITATRFLQPANATLPVFTWVPQSSWDGACLKHEYGDETPYVEAIARMHPQIQLNLVTAEGLDQYHLQDEFLDAAEGPARNALNLCWMHEIQSQARGRGISTLLQGTLGNLTLTWDGRDVSQEWFRNGQWARMFRHWWALYGGSGQRLLRFLPRAVWRELVAADAPDWLWRLNRRRFEKPSSNPKWHAHSAISPDYASSMSLQQRAKQYNFRYFERTRHITRAERLSLLTSSFANELGPVHQGMRALHGVELRDPFADRRVLQFALGIPTEQYAKQGEYRRLIRRMMSSHLPVEITRRQWLTGRQCADWHSRMTPSLQKMKAELETLEHDDTTRRMIDTQRIRRVLEDWPKNTVTDVEDERVVFLPTIIPLTTQIGRFVRRTKGANE